MSRSLFATCCFVVLGATLAGCGNGSSVLTPQRIATPAPSTAVAVATPTPTASPVSAAAVYYVSDAQAAMVDTFAVTANGNVAPLVSIAGSATGLAYPRRVEMASGILYVANAPAPPAAHSITEYATSASGNVAPTRTISGSATGLTGADGIHIDGSGNLYVANCTTCYQSSGSQDSIFEFAPGANGNVAPTMTLSGSNTQLFGTTNMTVDAAGSIYATSATGAPSILVFAPGSSGNVAPTRVISGSLTGLGGPECVVVDSAGDIYVCNNALSTITEYGPGASGNVAPIRTIGGSSTLLANPTQLAFGPSGSIYVADAGGQSITVYAASASGNVAPTAIVKGSATTLQVPIGLSF